MSSIMKRTSSSEHPSAPIPPSKILKPTPSQSSPSQHPPELDLVDDLLTPIENMTQDKEVMVEAEELEATPADVVKDVRLARDLLWVVISKCIGHMKPQYANFIDTYRLCRDNEQIRLELSKALESRSFSTIRCLAILRRPPGESVAEFAPTRVIIRNEAAQKQAIEKAWNIQYQDQIHIHLYEAINKMPRNLAYQSMAAIVQSSGTGKSRLVDEQAKLVFTLPFNLRDDEETEQTLAWPLPDPGMKFHLADGAPKQCIEVLQIYYLVFFTTLFETVEKHLRTYVRTKKESYEELAMWWREHLRKKVSAHPGITVREWLYSTVIEMHNRTRAAALLARRTPTGRQDIRSDQTEVMEGAQSVEESVPSERPASSASNVPSEMMELAEEDAPPEEKGSGNDWQSEMTQAQQSAGAALLKLLKQLSACVNAPEQDEHVVKLILYFDEAHILTTKPAPPNPDEKKLYDVLCSTLEELRRHSIAAFALFLSTNSSLSRFAPIPTQAASGRARTTAKDLQAPITEIPFDCSRNFPINWATLTYAEICTVDFMAQFGRPLFWTMLEGAQDKSKIRSNIIPLARAKLTSSQNVNSPYGDGNEETCKRGRLAVVDLRLCLDYEPRRVATSEEAALIEHHMRIAYSVPQSREYVHAGYPSEPILAEAAAQQLAVYRQDPSGSMPRILMKNLEGGLLNVGERGEVVARALFTMAYDRTVEKEHADAGLVKYSLGCSLVGFIQQLFPENHAELILSSPPCNVDEAVPFREAFKHASVRFTHFDKVADDGCMNTQAMLGAFVRGMAFICRNGAPMIDFVVPVLLNPKSIKERSMTAILVQVKRRDRRGQRNKNDIQAEKLALFASVDDKTKVRPVITLVMELGVKEREQDVEPAPPPDVPVTAVSGKKKGKKGKKGKGKEKEHSEGSDAAPAAASSTARKVFQAILVLGKRGKKHHPARAVTHPRYNFFSYGCSDKVYKVISPEEIDQYGFLLANRGVLQDHPRKSKGMLDAVRKMKPFWTWTSLCWLWAWPNGIASDPSSNDGGLGEEGVVCCVDGEGDEDFVLTDEDQLEVDQAQG
ncbi:hypothetical protein B0H21DRAFT_820225 [Amylocystis lapponica]|nr:hypothetical protein B0H21DRAFT_820225 [Amylocystis lapponica]